MYELNLLADSICLIYLAILSVQDIRNHTVSLRFLAAGGMAAAVWQIICKEQTIQMCAAGIFAGLIFVGISRLTREALGYGDSILILILGIYEGFRYQMSIIGIAFTISAVFSIAVLIIKKWNRKKAFPFIPFLTLGYLVVFIAGRS
ncbi:MAG: prepilin peptidase [Ruminococcus sp.]|nr:prepilin peptidase [Ruminococcus sp.]